MRRSSIPAPFTRVLCVSSQQWDLVRVIRVCDHQAIDGFESQLPGKIRRLHIGIDRTPHGGLPGTREMMDETDTRRGAKATATIAVERVDADVPVRFRFPSGITERHRAIRGERGRNGRVLARITQLA